MSDVLEFIKKPIETKETEMNIEQPQESNIKEILEECIKEADKVQDIIIFLKDKNEDYTLFHSFNVSLPDKAFLIQLLQHDIYSALTPSEDVIFETE